MEKLTPRRHRFADCLETYGAKVTQIGAPVGGRPSLDEIETALKKEKFAVLTFTHVDTCSVLSLSLSRADMLTTLALQRLVCSLMLRLSASSSSALVPTLSSFSMESARSLPRRFVRTIGTSMVS